MKIVQITGPALAALLVTACGARSQHASAPERAAQQAAEDKQEAEERAQAARLDADKARLQAQEAARAEREAQWNAQMATQREAQAQAQVTHEAQATYEAHPQALHEAHPQDVPRAGVTDRQADSRTVKVVLFATDSAVLSDSAKAKLNDVSKALRDQPKPNNVIVEGYTDDTGAEKNNIDLSRKRAEEVANYLESKGIARERITTKALGSHPSKAGTGERPALRETMNRRVEVVIQPAGNP
jgi:outer membrane protein OmpA-like peptidoglycan-associated protein